MMAKPVLSSEPFDEFDWLEAFHAVGGSCWLSDQDGMVAGWEILGRSDVDQRQARRLLGEILDHPQRLMREHQLADLLEFAQVLREPAGSR